MLSDILSRLVSYYRELRRRHVVRVGAAYAVVAWVATQVASVVFPALALPRWTVTATVLAALAGFPVALVLAWVIEPLPDAAASVRGTEIDAGPEAPPGPSRRAEQTEPRAPLPHLRVAHPIGLFTLVVALVGAAGWLVWKGRPLELSAFPTRGWVVLSDFRGAAAGTLGPALTAGLRLSLEQSPQLNVMPRRRVLDALHRMRASPDGPLGEATAREVAIREGADLVLVPTVASVGGRYRLGVRIENPATGEDLRTLTTRADGRDRLLEALDALAAKVREALGEPRLWVLRRSRPLEKVTTSSLQALRAYSLARRAHMRNDFAEALRLYETAVREDSTFVSAVAALGMLEFERFDRQRGKQLLERAFHHLEGLTDRERYGVLTLHAIAVEDDLDEAAGYERALLDLYPDSYVAHNNLGRIDELRGRWVEAVASYERALEIYPALGVASNGLYYALTFHLGRLDSALVVARSAVEADSMNATAWMQLGLGLFALDSLEGATDALARAVELEPADTPNRYRLAHLYRIRGRYDEAASILREILRRDSTQHAADFDLGVTLAEAGRVSEAHRHLRANLAYWSSDSTGVDGADVHYNRAVLLFRLGEPVRAARELARAVEADSTRYFQRARLACLRGREKEAVTLLGRAVEAGDVDFIWMKMDPDLGRLRDRPDFRALVRQGLLGGKPLPGEAREARS